MIWTSGRLKHCGHSLCCIFSEILSLFFTVTQSFSNSLVPISNETIQVDHIYSFEHEKYYDRKEDRYQYRSKSRHGRRTRWDNPEFKSSKSYAYEEYSSNGNFCLLEICKNVLRVGSPLSNNWPLHKNYKELKKLFLISTPTLISLR